VDRFGSILFRGLRQLHGLPESLASDPGDAVHAVTLARLRTPLVCDVEDMLTGGPGLGGRLMAFLGSKEHLERRLFFRVLVIRLFFCLRAGYIEAGLARQSSRSAMFFAAVHSLATSDSVLNDLEFLVYNSDLSGPDYPFNLFLARHTVVWAVQSACSAKLLQLARNMRGLAPVVTARPLRTGETSAEGGWMLWLTIKVRRAQAVKTVSDMADQITADSGTSLAYHQLDVALGMLWLLARKEVCLRGESVPEDATEFRAAYDRGHLCSPGGATFDLFKKILNVARSVAAANPSRASYKVVLSTALSGEIYAKNFVEAVTPELDRWVCCCGEVDYGYIHTFNPKPSSTLVSRIYLATKNFESC
jgi:hypothetical protein